jgi:hypothetical protein
MTAHETSPADAPARVPGGVFKDWILPIVIGLAIGAGIVLAWRHGSKLFESAAWRIAARWEVDGWEENQKLEQEIRGLGKEARADVLRAFRRVEVPANPWAGEDRWKVWVGKLLAGEPFFDARSLLDIARDPGAPEWDRRCAAAALVEAHRKDVDTTAVVEPLLAWVEDQTLFDHEVPRKAIRQMRADQVFPPQHDERYRKALLVLASKEGHARPEEPEDEVILSTDRDASLRDLDVFLSHDDVKAAVWGVARDETDQSRIRSSAVQILARERQFQDVEAWRQLAASKDEIVRQTVAENLIQTREPAFDGVLAPLHEDAAEFVRLGSVETQTARGRPTALAVIDLLVEDHSAFVRRAALVAIGRFKEHLVDLGKRQAMALRLLETSDAQEDVEGALIALTLTTGQTFGLAPGDVETKPGEELVRGVDAFAADTEGRRQAAAKWRELLGASATWTDADRRATLEKLAQHADPANQQRARDELAKLPAR